MKSMSQTFIWSDGWWLEDDKGWFVDGMSNTLFCVDLNTGECEKVCSIPGSEEGTYRQNPYCFKCGSDIYCTPGSGGSIWIYNLDNGTLIELEMDRPKQHELGSQFWIWGEMVFLVTANWNKIIEVSISQKAITNYYTICENDGIRGSVLVGDDIYAVSSKSGIIYQFDLMSKEVRAYLLPGIENRISTICFDGEKFWLSGYQDEVYIWNKEKDNLTTINFSNQLEESYSDNKVEQTVDNCSSPVFNRVVAVGEYIWFIPIRKGKIVYANKVTTELFMFEVFEEDGISVALKKAQGIGNYLLEYVRNDRYIGLFSANNSRVLEIDVKQLIYQWKEYYFSEQYLQCYCKVCEGIYYEGKDPLCIQAYHMRNQAKEAAGGNIDSIGMRIHGRLNRESMQ